MTRTGTDEETRRCDGKEGKKERGKTTVEVGGMCEEEFDKLCGEWRPRDGVVKGEVKWDHWHNKGTKLGIT